MWVVGADLSVLIRAKHSGRPILSCECPARRARIERLRRTALTTLKSAVPAPTPNATVTTENAVSPGARRKEPNDCRICWNMIRSAKQPDHRQQVLCNEAFLARAVS